LRPFAPLLQPFGIGSDYDLFSVTLHETGLALGLSETPGAPTQVMNGIYHGVLDTLGPGDVAGIQAVHVKPAAAAAPPGIQAPSPIAMVGIVPPTPVSSPAPTPVATPTQVLSAPTPATSQSVVGQSVMPDTSKKHHAAIARPQPKLVPRLQSRRTRYITHRPVRDPD
jgi:hypothetical protein